MRPIRRLCLIFMPLLLALSAGCGEAQLDEALAAESFGRAKAILSVRPNLAHDVDEDGRTRLHRAVLGGRLRAAELLISKGADVGTRDRYGYTAFHYAAQRGYQEIAALLVDKRAGLEIKTHYGYTPLHCAAQRGQREMVEFLIARGADVFARDNDGNPPSQLAYEEGHVDISGLLMPLHDAAQKGDIERIRSLLEQHRDLIDARDYEGRTPLHAAVRHDQSTAAELLVSLGADKEAKDNYGFAADYYSLARRAERTGVDLAVPSFVEKIDRIGYEALSRYEYLKVGIVHDGRIVFTKKYGDSRLESDDVWGSVSKPVTAMLVMHLVSTGLIESIDDPIWKYSPRYQDSMPARYAGDLLTIRHLLIHTSGVPHNDEPTWKDGKLNLKFKPGTRDSYSTPGYGILGHVIEDVTGKTYSDAVKTFIGKPVGAGSFWAEKHFRAPGARVHSTIEDMARFSIGVMNHVYVPSELFYGEMIQYHGGPAGIGWGVLDKDSPDVIVFHGGSNGRPQAYLEIKPRKKMSINILARARDPRGFKLGELSGRLLSVLEDHAPPVARAVYP